MCTLNHPNLCNLNKLVATRRETDQIFIFFLVHPLIWKKVEKLSQKVQIKILVGKFLDSYQNEFIPNLMYVCKAQQPSYIK